MDCKIIYKGISYDESEFKNQINRYIAINQLFESDSNLANQVYKSLGIIIPTNVKVKGKVLYAGKEYPNTFQITFQNNDNKYIGFAKINNQNIDSIELQPEFRKQGLGTEIYVLLGEELAKNNITLESAYYTGSQLTQQAKATWESLVKKGYAIKTENNYKFVSKAEQKQQALQLYSQYLDTIFPDSKVKDIVYHISPSKFENFDNSFIGKAKKQASPDNQLGIFFTKELNYIKGEDKENELGEFVYPTIVNIKNPNTNYYEVLDKFIPGLSNKDYLSESSRKYYNQTRDFIKSQNQDGIVESARPFVVVFDANQTHILGSKQDIEGFKEFVGVDQNTFLQKEQQSIEKPSENIDNKVKNFLRSIGVDVNTVKEIRDNEGNLVSAIAAANMLNKIIQIVEGKADITTLPEEAAHFFVEMLGENNPLFKQMYSQITSYKVYKETLDNYRDNPLYRNKDGSLNIDKIKKEAIGKLIMKHIINKEGGNESVEKIKSINSWWSKLLDFIKKVFSQNKKNPFETSATKILESDISDLNTEINTNEIYLQYTPQESLNSILKDQKVLGLDDSIDPKTGQKKHVYTENSRPIVDKNGETRSVTKNVVDPWYKKRFTLDTRTERQKFIDEFKAERGTDLHEDMQNIILRYFNTDGTPKNAPDPIDKSKIKTNDMIYDKLENYILQLIKEHNTPGTRFLSEVKIYDRKRNLPGTIDLLILEADGTAHIYDWKSQEIDKDQTELKWFKPEAYRVQLNEYRRILQEEYGIFKFGKIRAIPIATKIKYSNVSGVYKPHSISDIELEYDVNKIPTKKDYLLPVAMLNESTGDEELDMLLIKLNGVYEKISQREVKQSEKLFKHHELNELKRAINNLQIRKDLSKFIENGILETEKYNTKIQNGTFTLTDALDSILILSVYAEATGYVKNLLTNLKDNISNEKDPDVKSYLENLQTNYLKMTEKASYLIIKIRGIKGQPVPKGVLFDLGKEFAEKEGITTLLNPEKEMDFVKRTFRSLTTLPTAALKTFALVLRRAQGIRNIKIDNLHNDLDKLRLNLEKWGLANGVSKDKLFDSILEIDEKGKWNGNFLRIYSPEYFTKRDEALKKENVKWLKENTVFDEEEYNKAYELLKQNLDEKYPGNSLEITEKKNKIIFDWEQKHNPKFRLAYLNPVNYYIKPSDKWFSEKYKNLYKKDSSGQYVNKALVDVYEYFQKQIKESAKLGMIDKYSARFIPYILSNKITDVLGSSFKNVYSIQGAFDSIAVDADGGFGNIDPINGLLKKQLPVYFKRDLSVEKADGTQDYSNKSKDLFSVFSVWGQQMYNYEAMDSIKVKSDALVEIEKNKSRLETNMYGNVSKDKKIIAENEVNAKVLEQYVNYYIYGQSLDANTDKVVTVNGKSYSGKRALQKLIKLGTFKTLAINIVSGTATFVGGTANAMFVASKKRFFTERDWGQGIYDFTSNNDVTIAGLDFFDLGLDDRTKRDARDLSTSWKKRNMKWDHLLFIQHYGDKWATYPVAATMLRTYMFENNKIVSIRDYVKQKNNYDTIYSLPEAERKDKMKKIEKEIEELQNTKSLKAVGKIVDGKFEIPGLERDSDAAFQFKAAVQKTLKTIIGNATKDDINNVRMGIMGQVFMQFRSWMPQMFTERFGELSYDIDLETWEYGKARLLVKHLLNDRALYLLKELVTGFGNNTIQRAKDRYNEYVQRLLDEGVISDPSEFMSEAEFIDMYTGNLRSMMREAMVILAFLALLFSGDDDKDETENKGIRMYIKKALEKYLMEFGFYYTPTEFTKMLDSPLPIIGLIGDFERFITQGVSQIYGFAIDDEEIMKDSKPAKYLFKILPVTKEGIKLYAIFDDEYRKEWAIK